MLALIATSVVLHTLELSEYHHPAFSLARAPRPFIMIRYLWINFGSVKSPRSYNVCMYVLSFQLSFFSFVIIVND